MFVSLRAFSAKQGAASSVRRLKRTVWRTRILPVRAAIIARVRKVTGAFKIFAGDGLEYVTHGLKVPWGLKTETLEDSSTSSGITWTASEGCITKFFTVDIECGHHPEKDGALSDLSMLD